jgi:hypothetical protein
MRSKLFAGVAAATLLALPALAQEARVFNRVGTFEVTRNLPADRPATGRSIAEIVAASADGNTLVYVDGERKAIGFVDIRAPERPMPAGFLPMEGEPNSVTVVGPRAYVAVDTSPDKVNVAGHVATVDMATRRVAARCEIGGQPDSITASRDGRFLVIVIENERNERLNNGRIPQLPAGDLTIIPISDTGLDCAALRRVALTNMAEIAPEDPEPEFVDVNGRGEAVVTLQENNHIAIVDVASGRVITHFPAGAITLDRVDRTRDNIIRPNQRIENVKREPDAVKWLDDTRFVTANEGDYEGGSRGFTIFNRDGRIEFDSGNTLEHLSMRLGHYPERRSGNRGAEPEGVEVGVYDGVRYIFVGLERASLIAVYRDEGPGRAPTFVQALPTGTAPEGMLAIPARGLFVSANEADNPESGLRSSLMIYRLGTGPARYPTIESANGVEGTPIPWGALSGLAADRNIAGRLYAVTDSFYAEPRILTVDATTTPARIVAATTVRRAGRAAENLDLEGIAVRPGGGFWLASEGNPERQGGALPDLLLRVSALGDIEEEIRLPEAIARHAMRFGFEGVTVTGSGESETVWLAVQREWRDDPRGRVKILSYRVATGAWGVYHYPLETPRAGWIGLSEITAISDDTFVVIERDNQWGAQGIKRLYAFSVAGLAPTAPGGTPPVVTKRLVRDLAEDLAAPAGIPLEKVEGFTIDREGNAFFVTDNDGVDSTSGETLFQALGRLNVR